MPNADGLTNQVLATDGAGKIVYADVDIQTVGIGTTTDATETTIVTIGTNSNSACVVEAHIIGIRTDSGQEAGGFVLRAVFRNNGGSLIKVGDDKMYAKDSSWDANCKINGTDIGIAVTGEVGKTINWKASCKTTSV